MTSWARESWYQSFKSIVGYKSTMAKSAKIACIEALEKDLEVAFSVTQTKRIETLEVKISELENHLAILPSSSDRPTKLEASQSDAFEFFYR